MRHGEKSLRFCSLLQDTRHFWQQRTSIFINDDLSTNAIEQFHPQDSFKLSQRVASGRLRTRNLFTGCSRRSATCNSCENFELAKSDS